MSECKCVRLARVSVSVCGCAWGRLCLAGSHCSVSCLLLSSLLSSLFSQMELMMGDSRQSVQTLQSQLDEFRDRSRRDLQDAQRLSKERLTEMQRAQASNKNLQEEVREREREREREGHACIQTHIHI